MNLSAGLEWGSDMGSLISQDQLDTVTAHVNDAVAQGATVLAGGNHRPDLGPFFFEPTILEGVTPEMTCFGTETFGPVISLYRFSEEADAVARANDGEYGLNASIYSRDTGRARIIARQVKCGTVNINEAACVSPGWAGARAARASTATPRPRRLPPRRFSGSARSSG
jgi:succinate-semialdehyde dehydrogenase/glutarate-semialdehyde dehydrogenase